MDEILSIHSVTLWVYLDLSCFLSPIQFTTILFLCFSSTFHISLSLSSSSFSSLLPSSPLLSLFFLLPLFLSPSFLSLSILLLFGPYLHLLAEDAFFQTCGDLDNICDDVS